MNKICDYQFNLLFATECVITSILEEEVCSRYFRPQLGEPVIRVNLILLWSQLVSSNIYCLWLRTLAPNAPGYKGLWQRETFHRVTEFINLFTRYSRRGWSFNDVLLLWSKGRGEDKKNNVCSYTTLNCFEMDT